MTPEQFADLKKLLTAEVQQMPTPIAMPVVKSGLDKLPIPTGWKTIIGIVGFAATSYLQTKGAVGSADLTPYQPLLDAAMYGFGSLGGLGLVAKFDRFIKIAIMVLGYAPQVVELLQRLETEAKKSGDLR